MSCFEDSVVDRGMNLNDIVKFNFRRRIFSLNLLYKELNGINDIELQTLYEQIKKNYLYKIFSGVISDTDSIYLSAILIEFIKRKTGSKEDLLSIESKEIENFIEHSVIYNFFLFRLIK